MILPFWKGRTSRGLQLQTFWPSSAVPVEMVFTQDGDSQKLGTMPMTLSFQQIIVQITQEALKWTAALHMPSQLRFLISARTGN